VALSIPRDSLLNARQACDLPK